MKISDRSDGAGRQCSISADHTLAVWGDRDPASHLIPAEVFPSQFFEQAWWAELGLCVETTSISCETGSQPGHCAGKARLPTPK